MQFGPATIEQRPEGRWYEGFPVSGWITSPFGAFEDFRAALGWSGHLGNDFAAWHMEGVPIHLPAPGRPVAARFDPVGGWMVIVDHGDGFEGFYCHMQGPPLVAPSLGAETPLLPRGTLIGRVGATGSVTGDIPGTPENESAHLHWGVKKDGVWVDALTLIAATPAVEAVEESPPVPASYQERLTVNQGIRLMVDALAADSYLPAVNARVSTIERDGDGRRVTLSWRGEADAGPF